MTSVLMVTAWVSDLLRRYKFAFVHLQLEVEHISHMSRRNFCILVPEWLLNLT